MMLAYMSTLTQPEQAPGTPADFINERELLTRLPVSRRTVFNWRASGKIPHVKIGRRNLFHWPSVENALLRQQQGIRA
jgi:predicted DNA-binding transcriptional regulator AlpA